MGFDGKAELSSREARIRKRTEYKKSQEEFEYPEKSSQGIKTHKGREHKRTKRETQSDAKRKRQEGLKELEGRDSNHESYKKSIKRWNGHEKD